MFFKNYRIKKKAKKLVDMIFIENEEADDLIPFVCYTDKEWKRYNIAVKNVADAIKKFPDVMYWTERDWWDYMKDEENIEVMAPLHAALWDVINYLPHF